MSAPTESSIPEPARPARRRRRRRWLTLMVTAGVCWAAATFFLILSFGSPSANLALRRTFATAFALAGTGAWALRALLRHLERRAQRLSESSCDGAALAIVVTIGAAASVLALALLSLSQTQAAGPRLRCRRATFAMLAADEAFRRLRELAADPDPRVDHLGEAWAAPARRTLSGNILVESRVEDENRRLNLNDLLADGPLPSALHSAFLELMRECGVADPRARLETLREAARGMSRGSGLPTERAGSTARPARFRLWADVESVTGFEPDFWDARRPSAARPMDFFTVLSTRHGRPTGINLNTASAQVLAALLGPGLEAGARTVLGLREAAPLRSLEPVAVVTDALRFRALAPHLSVQSEWFRVDVSVSDPSLDYRLQVLAQRDATGVRIAQWIEP